MIISINCHLFVAHYQVVVLFPSIKNSPIKLLITNNLNKPHPLTYLTLYDTLFQLFVAVFYSSRDISSIL